MPYVAGVSTKPPGVFLVHALSIVLFGDHMWSIRIVDLGFVLTAGVLIATFRARRRVTDGSVVGTPPRVRGEIGAACLAVSGVYFTFFDFNDTAHPELWQSFFMLAPAWLIVRAPNGVLSARRAFAAGLLACVAVTFKHVAAITGVFCGVAIVLLALRRLDWRSALRDAGVYTLGVALVLLLTIAPFWLTGTFDAFWEFMVDFILKYAAQADRRRFGVPRFLTPQYGLYGWIAALLLFFSGFAVTSATRNSASAGSALDLRPAPRRARVGVHPEARLRAVGVHLSLHRGRAFPRARGAWALRQSFPRRGAAQLAGGRLPGGGGVPAGPDLELQPPLGLPTRVVELRGLRAGPTLVRRISRRPFRTAASSRTCG